MVDLPGTGSTGRVDQSNRIEKYLRGSYFNKLALAEYELKLLCCSKPKSNAPQPCRFTQYHTFKLAKHKQKHVITVKKRSVQRPIL